MKNRTSLKLKGRFFKANDPTTKIVDVTNFDLMEICDYPISLPDNPHANIFHSRLHDKSEIEQVIGTEKLVNTEFELKDARPVIKPLDFTHEWRKHRRRMIERQNRGDDDDIDFEQEGFAKSLRHRVSSAIKEISQEQKEEEDAEQAPGDADHIEDKTENDLTSQTDTAADNIPDADASSDKEEHSFSAQSEPEDQAEEDQPQNFQPFHFSQKEDDEAESAVSQDQNDGFVPMHPAVHSTAQDKVQHSVPDPKEMKAAMEEAQARGYEEGFRLGEEKALLSVQDKIQQTIQEVQSIVQELEGLKSNILHNAQENFQVLCQALMESLLQQQFNLNPESFQQVIQRAIDEAVPDDRFIIHVSQKAFENLKSLADEKFLAKLKVDQNMQNHDFKIESNLTVVDGNISQIISDLLEEADTSLFESPEKVS